MSQWISPSSQRLHRSPVGNVRHNNNNNNNQSIWKHLRFQKCFLFQQQYMQWNYTIHIQSAFNKNDLNWHLLQNLQNVITFFYVKCKWHPAGWNSKDVKGTNIQAFNMYCVWPHVHISWLINRHVINKKWSAVQSMSMKMLLDSKQNPCFLWETSMWVP